jgi:DNA-binding IclR family transcriptional regulator
MPLYWTIDSRQQFVVVTADGDVTHADAEAHLAAIEGCGAVAYRKLYDGRAGNFVMSHDEMMAIGAKIRNQHHRPVGALAIVLPHDQHEPVARILGILASADRPLKLFTSVAPAQRWIDTLVPAP